MRTPDRLPYIDKKDWVLDVLFRGLKKCGFSRSSGLKRYTRGVHAITFRALSQTRVSVQWVDLKLVHG